MITLVYLAAVSRLGGTPRAAQARSDSAAAGLLALRGGAADDRAAVADRSLSLSRINPLVVKAEYAVRGRLLDRARELEEQLEAGDKLPFTYIVRCNIGNPQALGQKPLTFTRQVLSLLMNPALLESEQARALYPADAIERAKAYKAAITYSIGAYSESQGVGLVRQHVAEFIAARDGYPADAADIFLTDGASAGVKALMQLLIQGPSDALLTPIPQYPLYSAVTQILNGSLAP